MTDRAALSEDPLEQFQRWLDEVESPPKKYRNLFHFFSFLFWRLLRKLITKAYPEAVIDRSHSMVLATANSSGKPSARVVLLKGYSRTGFVFFTNYRSTKAQELTENDRACLLFHWQYPERQIRIDGTVQKTSESESQAYWDSRPRLSQLSALASPQSSKIQTREELESRVQQLTQQFKDQKIPCPEHWGGYRLKPDRFEFWEVGANRLHDRFVYQINEPNQRWEISRLAP